MHIASEPLQDWLAIEFCESYIRIFWLSLYILAWASESIRRREYFFACFYHCITTKLKNTFFLVES